MFSSVPPVRMWSIFAAEFITAVGPLRSAPCTGEMPSLSGRPGAATVGRGAHHLAEVHVQVVGSMLMW